MKMETRWIKLKMSQLNKRQWTNNGFKGHRTSSTIVKVNQPKRERKEEWVSDILFVFWMGVCTKVQFVFCTHIFWLSKIDRKYWKISLENYYPFCINIYRGIVFVLGSCQVMLPHALFCENQTGFSLADLEFRIIFTSKIYQDFVSIANISFGF